MQVLYRRVTEKVESLKEFLRPIKKNCNKATEDQKQKPGKASWKNQKGRGGKDEAKKSPRSDRSRSSNPVKKENGVPDSGN